MTPERRLLKARVQLLCDHPFFGTLVSRLPSIFDTNVPTACTNGQHIRWNPDFLTTLTDDEVKGVYAHEVMHVAYGHTWRRETRDPVAWNIACDKAINHVIKEAGLKLPNGVLWPDAGDEGKASEHYYQRPQECNKPGPGQEMKGGKGARTQTKGSGPSQPNGDPSNGAEQGSDPGNCGGVEDSPPEEAKQLEAEWKVAVAQAAAVAKSQGTLPGDLARAVADIVDPKVAWEVLLRDFVERSARNDYNWTQANRRHLQRGFILPSLVSEELPAIVVAVDTSGSVSTKELDQFAAEISAVLGAYQTTIHVVYCDSRVAGTEELTRADLPLKLSPKGGGGTCFAPVFDWVTKEGLTPACLVYLTDMYGSFPPAAPDYPVLWVSTSTTDQAPFGDVVLLR